MNLVDNTFTYPLSTYLLVLLLSSVAGAVKYLNNIAHYNDKASLLVFLSDTLSGALAGLMAFWICDSTNITGSIVYVIVTVSGAMGIKAWNEFERLVSQILRIPNNDK